MKRLAHLNALRAFEIAARAGSFAKAADELCVTPAAVSQQVRLLEAYLGVPLFHRHGSRLGPTEAAELMLPDIIHGFERLSRGMQKALEPWQRSRQVKLSAPSAFVAKWLIPRLEAFRAEHPHICLQITCAGQPGSAPERSDLRVVPGAAWEEASSATWPLFTDVLLPVCSPRLRAQLDPRKGPRQLQECVLIHDNGNEAGAPNADWDRLLHELKLPTGTSRSSIAFGDSLAAALAARQGLGVLLGRHFVVEEDLGAGTLVLPFEPIRLQGPTYKAVLGDARQPCDETIALKDWLVAQAQGYRQRVQPASSGVSSAALAPAAR